LRARRAARHVFRTVINIKNFRSAPSGEFLQRLVNFGVGLHGLDLVRINVAVKITEERKISPDVLDRQVIGVRENVGRNAAAMQSGVQFNHRRNGRENVREKFAKFFQCALKAGDPPRLLKKFQPGQPSGFVVHQQMRVEKEGFDSGNRQGAVRGDARDGDAVIEIHQDLAQIKYNNFRGFHDRRYK